MKFSEEVSGKFSSEFMDDIAPFLENLVAVYNMVYYIDEANFGRGNVPRVIAVVTDTPNRDIANSVVPILNKYSSPDTEDAGGVCFLQLDKYFDGLKELASYE